jgi:hypothetical protein
VLKSHCLVRLIGAACCLETWCFASPPLLFRFVVGNWGGPPPPTPPQGKGESIWVETVQEVACQLH